MHDQYWRSENATAEAASARILGRGKPVALPPVLLLAHSEEDAHLKPDRVEFIRQYRNAGGLVSENIFEGKGGFWLAVLLEDLVSVSRSLASSWRR